MKFCFFILGFILYANGANAQEKDSLIVKERPEQVYQISDDLQYVYQKPTVFGFITHIPRNYVNLGKETIKKKNLKWLGVTIAATAIMYSADEWTIEKAQHVRKWGVTEKHEYNTLFDMIDVPLNTSAAMYHLGHGNTSLLVSGGFLIVGGIKKDYRALHTGTEIVESILTLGIFTQGLKRVFGRESPEASTQPRGKWSGFPGWNEYMTHTSHYDAMPSGHVATLTSTVTVLSKNYPEIKWIKPVGYTLIGVLGIEMMNSGVHWSSDYPLGFLIGYSVGSVVANGKIKKIKTDPISHQPKGFDAELMLTRLDGENLIGVRFVF
jgi:hypothetical protein